ncbi:hypothetical protein LWC34_10230 [Kibdelosporangium philippinense]|uniref:PE family protein n=1 Tax=Kibdelosporangium philippinense TaxID=211113 RepID=A0ABS8Z8U7_9PSEU|nr:hypothetical protein [Kibdelosporangium philippinense]MCE7003205.1 hypothetical protein [Kibdelosporangium philippinense]
MDDGFRVALDELQRVGDQALPALRDIMAVQLPILTSHEGLGGPGRLEEVGAYQVTYARFTDEIAARQKHGAEVVDATAQAVKSIVALYRRADGQG